MTSAFVQATGYVTVAERPLDPADFPGAPAENLVPGSLVFTPTPGPARRPQMIDTGMSHIGFRCAWTSPATSEEHPS